MSKVLVQCSLLTKGGGGSMARVNSKDASGRSAEAPHSRARLDSKLDVFRAANALQYRNKNFLLGL